MKKQFKNLFKKNKYSLKISIKEKISLLDQISNLLNSWIPITNSLNIIFHQTKNEKIKEFLKDILTNINKWIPLKDSLKNYNNVFSQFDISIIEMWEVTWKLWDSIDIIRDKEEKNHDIKTKIKWALTYPIIIIILSIWMILTFMLYVIPKIQKMYKDAKVNLPDLTQFVIDISKFLQKNILELSFGVILLIILFITFKNHKKTKIIFDKYVLKLPLFWWLIRKKILSIFCRTLWTLLSNWILINKSLEIAKTTVENSYYEKEIDKVIKWVSAWTQLSKLMWIELLDKNKESDYFPIELASVVKIWEETWNLSKLLIKISYKFSKELDNVVKNLQTAIEPVVIIWVWIIIWTLIMAIMLPFFNMVNVI